MIEQDSTVADMQPSKSLGLDRWVQIAFMAFGLFTLWLLDKLITVIWDRFAEPPASLVTLLSAVCAVAGTLMLYKHERVSRATHEVVAELAKVSWPTRKETQVSTLVVIVTSVIASVIVGGLDATWSALTDLIYKA
jgi:preprotein translocase SecE subunit